MEGTTTGGALLGAMAVGAAGEGDGAADEAEAPLVAGDGVAAVLTGMMYTPSLPGSRATTAI